VPSRRDYRVLSQNSVVVYIIVVNCIGLLSASLGFVPASLKVLQAVPADLTAPAQTPILGLAVGYGHF
jgi:hypothetical protein